MLISILTVSIGFSILSCDIDSAKSKEPNSIDATDSIQLKEETFDCIDSFPEIKYRTVEIQNMNELLTLKQEYDLREDNKIKYRAMTTLNRKQINFFRVGGRIIIPDKFVEDLRAYSVFPQCYPGAKNIKKLIVVTNKYLAYACYEYGKLVRFAAANTGKERTPTYPGRYSLVWKSRLQKSSLDSNWIMPYTWNFHAQAGSAFHQFTMPGYAASHSCIRQFIDDAKWLFTWGERQKRDSAGKPIYMSGTPVIVIDVYDFARKKGGIWQDIKSNKDVILELPKDPMQVEEALIPIVQIPVDSRGSLKNRSRYFYAEDTLRARGIIRPEVKLTPTFNFNRHRRTQAAKKEKLLKEQELKKQELQIRKETFYE